MAIKKIFLSLLLAELLLCYGTAYAATPLTDKYNSGVSNQIKAYLCAPSDSTGATTGNSNGTDLYLCINQLYKFAIVLASVIGVFFLVIAGYFYMSAEGNTESVEKAKSILISTITSFILLFSGYLLLNAINPDLTIFQTIQPPSVVLPPPGPVDNGGATPADAQQAAKQILAIPSQINLATGHASGNADNATARQNIIDTSNGQAAQRSSYTDGGVTGPGGTIQLSTTMLKAILAAGNALPINVTEIAGGVHSAGNDPHYFGTAVDLKPQAADSNSQAQLVGILRSNGAKKIGLECVGGPNGGYLSLDGSNDGNNACIGKSGYHIHAQF